MSMLAFWLITAMYVVCIFWSGSRCWDAGRMRGLERGYIDGWKAGHGDTLVNLQRQLGEQGVLLNIIPADDKPKTGRPN